MGDGVFMSSVHQSRQEMLLYVAVKFCGTMDEKFVGRNCYSHSSTRLKETRIYRNLDYKEIFYWFGLVLIYLTHQLFGKNQLKCQKKINYN